MNRFGIRLLIFLPCFAKGEGVRIDDLHLYEEIRFIKFRKVEGMVSFEEEYFLLLLLKMKEGVFYSECNTFDRITFSLMR